MLKERLINQNLSKFKYKLDDISQAGFKNCKISNSERVNNISRADKDERVSG